MRKQPRQIARPRRGAVTSWMVVSLTVIVGVAALGIDGGRMFDERRRHQAAADAAALAAAAQLFNDYAAGKGLDVQDKAKQAALASLARNGFTGDATVNVPPTSGEFAGKSDYAEVILKSEVGMSFGRIFRRADPQVQARALARGRPVRLGLIALAPSGADAVVSTGKGTLTVVNAPVWVNSSDAQALRQASQGPMIASSFEVVGNYANSSGSLLVGAVHPGAQPIADPLRDLPIPDEAALTVRATSRYSVHGGSQVTLEPGVYQGGIEVEGSVSVTMKPGIYYIKGGGFTLEGSGAVVGAGVTIFNTGTKNSPAGPIVLGGSSTLTLTPPLTGTYQGVSVFQDRGVTAAISLQGRGLAVIAGVVYAPAAAVNLTGNSDLGADGLGGAIIAQRISIGGVGAMYVNPGQYYPRVPEVGLAE